jgi:hypothetical protein
VGGRKGKKKEMRKREKIERKSEVRSRKSGDGFFSALKGRHIIAQGTALGWRTPKSAPSFNAPALASVEMWLKPNFDWNNTNRWLKPTAMSPTPALPVGAGVRIALKGRHIIARGNALGRLATGQRMKAQEKDP